MGRSTWARGAGLAAALLAIVLLATPGPTSPHAVPTGPAAVREMAGAAAVAPAVSAPVWFNVTSGQRFTPPPAVGASMLYDPADNEMVLFGGCTAAQCPESAQTWAYAGGFWTNISSSSPQPPARAYAGFTWDSRDGYAVLFGGRGSAGLLNDTWEFLGGHWTNLTNASLPAPSPRWAPAFAFDRFDAYGLLFGGAGIGNAPLNDTWHFQGGAWKNITGGLTASPSARYGASATYDSGDNEVVLINGCATTCPVNDSWTYTRGRWVALALLPAPPARAFGVLTYDTVQNATYLFGGNSSGGPRSDTWRLAGGKWTNVTAAFGAAPSPRFGAAGVQTTIALSGGIAHKATFDLLFGGATNDSAAGPARPVGDSWVAEPPPSAGASLLPSLVEVGQPTTLTATGAGGSPPYTFLWEFGDGGSSLLQIATHVYLTAGSYLPNVTLSDSAGVSLRASTAITVVLGPVVTASASPATTDVGRPVSFTPGVSGGTQPYSYAWAFGDQTSATTASATHSYSSAGTFTATLTVTDTVLGLGAATVPVLVHPDPTLTSSVSTDTPTVGVAMYLNATAMLGTAPYVVRWSFGDGSTGTSASAVHTYNASGTVTVSLEITDAVGASAFENLSLRVDPPIDTHGGSGAWLGLSAVAWGVVLVVIAGVIALIGAFLLLRRRRRTPDSPIAAAAVGQPGWGGEEAAPPSGGSSSRSFRRSFRR